MLSLLPAEQWDYKVADVFRALGALLLGSSSEQTIELPELGPCVPVRSARAGLVVAIRALGLSKRAQVGVPLYCCPVVFKAIELAGCRPCFLDVNTSNFCVSDLDLAAKAPQLEAIIAVHMFGNVCDIPSLERAAPGKPIIEDCALSLGSKLEGRMTGSLGSIGIFSFRSGKYLSVGEGGALFAKDPNLRTRLIQQAAALAAPSRAAECVHIAKTYLRSKLRSRPLYGLVGHRLWQAYNNNGDFSSKCPVVLSRAYRADVAITKSRVGSLACVIAKQRANAGLYARTLTFQSDMLCSEPVGTFYNRYQYPITLASAQDRESLSAYLHDQNIETIRPFSDVVKIASEQFGYKRDCPVAERLSKTVLVVPSYSALSQAIVQRAAQHLNAALGKLSRNPPAVTARAGASGSAFEAVGSGQSAHG